MRATEDAAGEGFPSDRVLYTGTGKDYLWSVLSRFRKFKHLGQPYVYLERHPTTAMSYAAQRSIFYEDTPVVLVVDTDKLDEELIYEGRYKTKGLNIGCFLPYEFPLGPEGKFRVEDHKVVGTLAERIVQSSEAEIWQENAKPLLDLCRKTRGRRAAKPIQ